MEHADLVRKIGEILATHGRVSKLSVIKQDKTLEPVSSRTTLGNLRDNRRGNHPGANALLARCTKLEDRVLVWAKVIDGKTKFGIVRNKKTKEPMLAPSTPPAPFTDDNEDWIPF